MSPYLVLLLILNFFPSRLAMLPYGLDSNVTQLVLANLLTKPSVFYYLPIVSCNLVSIKTIIIIIIIILYSYLMADLIVCHPLKLFYITSTDDILFFI